MLIKTITDNLLAHFGAITTDITKTTSDLKDEKYYEVGDDVADLLVQALGQVTEV